MSLHPAKRPLKVIIIGAGIGGLAAACALRQRGIEVALYERSQKLEEVGAGLQIGPNGVKVLRALGLEDELMRNAFEPLSIMSITWDEGRLRFRQPLKAIAREKYGAPYMTAHRADLHNLLRRAIGDTPLRLGATCIGADTVERRRGGAFRRRHDGRSRYRRRRRRHPLCHPRAAFRRRRAALYRDDGLALHRADGLRADPRRARRQRRRSNTANISAGSGRTATSSAIRSASKATSSTCSAATSPNNGSRNPGRCRRAARS